MFKYIQFHYARLFNDSLCYGDSTGSGIFNFHRALDLSKCKVLEHSGNVGGKYYKHCFELLGSEKSFIAIAVSDSQRSDWIEKINRAAAERRQLLGINDDSIVVAAVWEQDGGGKETCTVCKQVSLLLLLSHYYNVKLTFVQFKLHI